MHCRLIESCEFDAFANMALDEALWRFAPGAEPTLRLYDWSDAPVLSLGYFQSSAACRMSASRYVRRITGGGAILHGRGTTYSLTLPRIVAPTARQLYRVLHEAIAAELREIGLNATCLVPLTNHLRADDSSVSVVEPRSGAIVRGQPSDATREAFLCFDRADNLAVCLNGVKVLGSAQRRNREAVLMQGELAVPDSPAERVVKDRNSLRAVLRSAIPRALECAAAPASVPSAVQQLANQLRTDRYRTTEWNDRC